METQNVDVIFVGELSSGALASHTYEIATLARSIGSATKCVLSSSNPSFDSTQAAQQLGEYGVSELHSVNCGSGLSGNALASYIKGLIDTAQSNSRSVIVVGPATYLGRDVLAHLSVFADRNVLANAVGLELNEDGVVSTHMIFGGSKILKAQSSGDSPQLVILRPKSIAPQVGDEKTECKVINEDASGLIDSSATTEIVNSEVSQSEGPALDEASIVVSGGRGLGSQDNYEKLVLGVANELGAATGASRAIVDAGWVPYSKQVGQTGKTVKPEVYIACGISGATQHLVGMKGSKNIIAINTDDQAPVFSVADLGIVADVNVVLPDLIEKLKARKN